MPKKLTTEQFIEKAKLVHGEKYDYSKVEYVNNHTKVVIVCKQHGEFLQKPVHHLIKVCGCPLCAGRGKPLTTETFIRKSKLIHGEKYDYSLSTYEKWNIPISIICKKHGVFKQLPNGHLFKQGCPRCKNESTHIRCNKGLNQFVLDSNLTHKNLYDYSNSIYKNNKIKVEIICKKHGIFWQTPKSHIEGQGCPKCTHIISKPEMEFLDYLKIPNTKENRQRYLQIGKIKVDGINGNKIFEFLGDFWHGNLEKFDKNDMHPILKKKYKYIYKNTFKRFKLLKQKGFKIYYIWESDWNTWKSDKIKTFPIKLF